ncbi:narrow isoform X2 [Arctopsyche grandis]
MSPLAWLVLAFAAAAPAAGQRITTIQLDGVQYFVSRMNPYSPELNYFLAYQYCRSLGLQLASFETKEKADSITTYLSNAGYTKYDFWTSGNNLGTDMFLWMSTGLPFNATFNYMKRGELTVSGAEATIPSRPTSMDPVDVPQGSTAPQRTARHGTEHVLSDGCVALKAPTFHWEPQHCGDIKDFICEQTRCYYYNYGSIPVSSAQG